jgi:hypothetical protein
LTAAVLMARIPRLEAFSHRLFNPTPSVAELTRGYSPAALRALTAPLPISRQKLA